jgi:hypothetical protein
MEMGDAICVGVLASSMRSGAQADQLRGRLWPAWLRNQWMRSSMVDVRRFSFYDVAGQNQREWYSKT